MPLVKVWNDNTYPYSENFKGQMIQIPPNKFITMEKGEAEMFRGTFHAPVLDGDGQQHPSSYKKIRIEAIGSEKEELKVTAGLGRCNLCGYESTDQTDLIEHSKSMHGDLFYTDPVAEKEMKNK